MPERRGPFQRWNGMVANDALPAEPLLEVILELQPDAERRWYWFCAARRELFAEERAGRWYQIEYVFPAGHELFVVSWTDVCQGKGSKDALQC